MKIELCQLFLGAALYLAVRKRAEYIHWSRPSREAFSVGLELLRQYKVGTTSNPVTAYPKGERSYSMETHLNGRAMSFVVFQTMSITYERKQSKTREWHRDLEWIRWFLNDWTNLDGERRSNVKTQPDILEDRGDGHCFFWRVVVYHWWSRSCLSKRSYSNISEWMLSAKHRLTLRCWNSNERMVHIRNRGLASRLDWDD